MGAAHILSQARNAAVTFSKPIPGRIFPELHWSNPAALHGLELRPRCVVECAGETWIKFLFGVCFIDEGIG